MAGCEGLGVSTREQPSGRAWSNQARCVGHSWCRARTHRHGQGQSAGVALGRVPARPRAGCGCGSG